MSGFSTDGVLGTHETTVPSAPPVSALAYWPTILLLAGSSRAQATTILDFENVPIGGGNFNGLYGGADWGTTQWYIFSYGTLPYPTAPGLGPQAIYFAGSGNSKSFTFLTPQIFQGAWFSGAGDNSFPTTGQLTIGTQLVFNLYDSSNALVHTSGSITTNSLLDPNTLQWTSGSAQFLASGYGLPVSRVEVAIINAPFSNSGFIMDGVTFDAPTGTPVPEPTSLVLLAGGLVALCATRPRRR